MTEWDEAERIRERLAHQLHDGPIQELTAAQLFLDGLSLRMEAEGAAAHLRDGLEQGLAALREATLACRDLMDRLRPGIDAEGELEARVARLVQGRWPAAVVEVAVPADLGRTRATEALMAFRVAEELLEEARRAGAEPRTVRLEEAPDGALVITLALEPVVPPPSTMPDSWRRAGIGLTTDADGWRAAIPRPAGD